jgi:GTP-binding protein
MNFNRVDFLISAASSKDFPAVRLPEIAFAGKSNVGKSSVINRLLQRKNFARVGEKPGKTVHVNYFTVDNQCYFVDLPGYGYAQVSQSEKLRWSNLMESYFAAARIDLGVLIVDARHPPTNNDITMARWFLDSQCPFVVVANKLDKVKKSELLSNIQTIRDDLELPETCPVIPFSAEKGNGRDDLVRMILNVVGNSVVNHQL